MQNPNAQGIMGALSQGQRQPAPSPNSASPMAGLGGVEDRVAAYRGNPAPLQQRYQMTQDLLDLLALQKIKSEKESAARQIQMQMAQHQAAEGNMGTETVAQQREKEVAQMVGGVARQDGARKEAAMRQMMSGIAGAPGANAAAQPQAMAAGGIVGYNGEMSSVVDTDERRRESRRRNSVSGEEFIPESLSASDIASQLRALPPAAPSARPAPARPAPRAAAPAAPVTGASLVAPMPNESMLPAAPPLPSVDPDAAMAGARKRMMEAHAYTDEERAIRDEAIAQARQRLADRSDPERNRMAGIMQALLAASRGGPRNVGALSGFAEGSIAADRQQRLEREAAQKELQAMLSTGRAERLAGVAAGESAGEAAGKIGAAREGNVLGAATTARGQTMQALMSMVDAGTRANITAAEMAQRERLAAADRAIQGARLKLEQDLRRETNENTIAVRIADGIRAVGDSVQKAYAPILNNLAMQISMGGNDPKKTAAAQSAYDATMREMDALIQKRTIEYRALQPQLNLVSVTPAPAR